MPGPYAYSFDQDTFRGRFDTRQQALDAAARALCDRADQPEGSFVGQWLEPDAQTAGHAGPVVAAMRDRWRQAGGDHGYLDAVDEDGLAELDGTLKRALQAWLADHDLLPATTRVRAVSHHPVPNVHHVAVAAGERETSLIGEA